MTTPWIAVGVDGSEAARDALYWAADEASRRHVELVIAHAGDVETETPTRDGSSLLLESEAAVFETDATCPVTTRFSKENPLRFLDELSREAELVVVGSQGLGRTAGAVLGSVAFRVAAHASCPVAVIPQQWRRPARPGPVVLGVSASAAGRTPMYVAFAQARALGVSVRAVRAWSRIDWTGDLADLMYKTAPGFESGQYDYLDRVLAPMRKEFPDVQVQTVIGAGRVRDVLMRESAGGQLLVLGSRFGDGHTYSRLGPLTSQVLPVAPCPAMVVGHRVPTLTETAGHPNPAASHA